MDKTLPAKFKLLYHYFLQRPAVRDIVYKNNSKKRVEFYYGSTYLSQSSRNLEVDGDVAKITITGYSGKQRKVN